MKKLFTLALLSTIPLMGNQISNNNINAFDSLKLQPKNIVKIASEKQMLLTHYWNLLRAMIFQESSFNTNIDGGESQGILQITIPFIETLNNNLGEVRYFPEDVFNVTKSIEMFLDYQIINNKSGDLEIAAKIWNGGKGAIKNGTAIDYWNNVKSKMNNFTLEQMIIADSLLNKYTASIV
jgi:hypothetical protein